MEEIEEVGSIIRIRDEEVKKRSDESKEEVVTEGEVEII